MSGHSKWSQIKHKKAQTDSQRSKLFGSLARDIAIAARGGNDPATNAQLRETIARARKANMPQVNIERLLVQQGERAVKEVIYEGFGSGGVALLIVTLTDNPNRTVAELRSLLKKNQGLLGAQGSNRWKFTAALQWQAQGVTREQCEAVELSLIEAQAVDVQCNPPEMLVTAAPTQRSQISAVLEQSGLATDTVENIFTVTPANLTHPSPAEAVANAELITILENHLDVVGVFTDSAPRET